MASEDTRGERNLRDHLHRTVEGAKAPTGRMIH